MTKLNTLEDGLIDQLKDLYSAENQLLKVLPKIEKKAKSQKLKSALHAHFLETEEQVERLDKIGAILQAKLTGKTCKAMQGLIEEGKEVLEEESENEALLDALLIAAAQRVEHYEIAAYGTASAMALELGRHEVVKLLEKTLDEEKKADKKLSAISEEEVLSQANIPSDMDEEEKGGSKKSSIPQKVQNQKRAVNMARLFGFLSCILLSYQFGSFAVVADTETEKAKVKNEREASNYKADNTGRNVRDRNLSRVTADDQSLSGNDLKVLAQIRKEVVANEQLSINGHNVKILVENGEVILRGPVNSAQEKTWIEEVAGRVASGYRVTNQLEVAPS